jgi:polyphosphate kinase 2 (PPK2 family)
VGQDEQERRMNARIDDPLRRWKLSTMDLKSWPHWYDYSKARDRMFAATDTNEAPWYILRSDDKRKARLNCMAHILSIIPYEKQRYPKIVLPKRSKKKKYDDQATLDGRRFVPESY